MTRPGLPMRRPSRQEIMLGIAVALATGTLLVGWCSIPERRWGAIESAVTHRDAGSTVRSVTFVRRAEHFNAQCVLLEPGQFNAQIVDVEPAAAPLNRLLDAHQAFLAVNGGYFDPSFAPIGLLRINGNDLSKSVSTLAGVVGIDSAGTIHVLSARDARVSQMRSAVQAGPFLIDPGGTVGIRQDDAAAAERTVIATDGTRVCIVTTTPMKLIDLAHCLHELPGAIGLSRVDAALNLDGGPSSGMIFRTADGVAGREPRGRIRSAIVLSPPR